jgi:glucosamine 6-phosphate synthetase-like amidotransferase/phosphosugar isomerase protein
MRMDEDELDLKWEHVDAGIDAQPAYLRAGAVRDLYDAAGELDLRVPSRIYLVGCGDSYYAGMATRFAFERWTGIPTEAMESLEFSRYAVEAAPADALVVVVSNSGRVTRTIEAAQFAGQRGVRCIALTYFPDSALARAATGTLAYTYEDVGFGPGTLSYLASLVALYALAIRIGVVAGRLGDAERDEHLDAITACGDAIEWTIAASRPAADAVAAQIDPSGVLTIIGGGPSHGTAVFGMAKFIESARHNAMGQELEEWAHEQYFVTGPGSHTFVVAPAGAAVDRAREQLRAVRDVDGTAVAICDPADEATCAMADVVLPARAIADELLSPMITAVPLELVALAYARRLGRTMLGFDDLHRREVNWRQIFGSSIPGAADPEGAGAADPAGTR